MAGSRVAAALASVQTPPQRVGALVADSDGAAQEGQAVSQTYVIDKRDSDALAQVRGELKARRLALGLNCTAAAARVGRQREFIMLLERGVSASPKLSSLQSWAAAVDCRIEFGFEGFWDIEHDDAQMWWLHAVAKSWGKDGGMRLWLIAALRAWRIAKNISVDVVADGLGVDRDGCLRWEWEATDPLFARLAATARLLDLELTMQVIAAEDWVEL